MHNRSGRLILNSIYSVLAWLAPVALGVLVTPFLLKRLGVEAYGVYLVILGFIGFSFTFNVNRAVAKFVAEFRTTGDVQTINSAITASFCISLAIGSFGAFVIALSAGWIVMQILQISPSFQRPATAALMIGGFSIPFILIGQVFQNILQGCHRFGTLSVITNLNWFLLNVGNVILVILGFGIDALLLWTVIAAGTIAVISYLSAKRAEPAYRLDFAHSRQMLRPVAAYGASIFLYQLFGGVLLIFERAWVTRNFGAETAAHYLVPMALVFYFHGLMASLTSAAFPVLNELLGDKQKSVVLYRKICKVLVSLTVLFLLSVCFGGRAFLTLWIDPAFAESSYRLLIIHSFTFGLIVVMMGSWQLNEAHRAAWINASLAAVWALISLPLMMAAADWWRADGIATSRLVGVALTLPIIFYVERRFLGGVQSSFWGSVSLKVGVAAIVLSVIEYFVFAWAGGAPGLILGWTLGTIGYFGMLVITGFVTEDEKQALLQLIGLGRAAIQ